MKIEIDFEGMLKQAIANALAPEAIQPVIQQKMNEVVASAINEQFRHGAPFKRLVEQSMAEAMPATLDEMGRFGDLVHKMVTEHLCNVQNEFIKQAMEPRLAALFSPVEKQITLGELCERMTRAFEAGLLGDIPECGGPTFIARESSTSKGFFSLHADNEPNKQRHQCSISMLFDSEGRCYSMCIDGSDIERKKFIGPAYDAEALALAIYTGMTMVEFQEIDPDDYRYTCYAE